jgi:ergothioneine biosynthesis protein EgtB
MHTLQNLKKKYSEVRQGTEYLCKNISAEDHVVQPIEDVSPPKWHLGHSSWFFEVFILMPYMKAFKAYKPEYHFLFNSYYESMGDRILRANRGNLSRPASEEIYSYRKYIDAAMLAFMDTLNETDTKLIYLIELGLNHEQQHQELLVYDIKYILGNNPLFPAYSEKIPTTENPVIPASDKNEAIRLEEGVYSIGYQGNGFCFDHEREHHKVYINGAMIDKYPVLNGEYLEFIHSGAYEKFEFWLSEGWDYIQRNRIRAPLYWHRIDNTWWHYTLSGLQLLDENIPVSHVSYYEADAYARWKNKRLPTEAEWEVAALQEHEKIPGNANFLWAKNFECTALNGDNKLFGDVWEWTSSAFAAYPGYIQERGALGEYNGKFMINQMVLRGGSYATPADHIRFSYRNFFHSNKRWQVCGFRLAQ